MKVKVLECPSWVHWLKDDYAKDNLKLDFEEVPPVFNRDGYYMVEGYKGMYRNVIIEFEGKAWAARDIEGALKAFDRELKKAEFHDINLLSKEQSDAIQTLMKVGLASEQQVRLYREDASKRYRSKKRFS